MIIDLAKKYLLQRVFQHLEKTSLRYILESPEADKNTCKYALGGTNLAKKHLLGLKLSQLWQEISSRSCVAGILSHILSITPIQERKGEGMSCSVLTQAKSIDRCKHLQCQSLNSSTDCLCLINIVCKTTPAANFEQITLNEI